VHQEASDASSLSAERRTENQPPREAGASRNSCEKGMKFFAVGRGKSASAGLGPYWTCFVLDFAGNKDASCSVGKFMLPSRGETVVN